MNKFFFAALICSALFLATTSQTRTEQSTLSIKLYVFKNCPYCHKVINFLKNSGHLQDVVILDASQSQNYKDLVALSGDSQVPFLYDEPRSKKMLESADIIEYFKTRFN